MAEHAVSLPEAEKLHVPEGHPLRKMPLICFAAVAVGVIACGAMAAMGHGTKQFYFSWLVAFVYFLSFALGGLVFVLIQHAATAGWSVSLRRVAEHAMGTLPVFAVLFLPLLIGMHELFEWTHVEEVRHDPFLAAKAPYLNVQFFVVRAVLYFGAWCLMAWWFKRQSLAQDRTGDLAISRRMIRMAGPALYAFAFTTTFAMFDWLMSLQPHWYSTIFGGYYFAGAMIAILAQLILVLTALKGAGFIGRAVNVEHMHDLGKLLFAFVVFWGYMAFSQFMLIWYANIPEETSFFHARYHGGWMTLSKIILFGHFLFPFFLLLPRSIKRNTVTLCASCVYLLLLHWVDMYWLVMPVLHPEGPSFHVLDVAAFLAIGGAFVGLFLRGLTRTALVPLKDPRMREALTFENF